MGSTRIDTDSLGSRELPANALYGVQSLRGNENFDISSRKLGGSPILLRAFARIKHAAASANRDLGVLSPTIAEAIIAASVEVQAGQHCEQFIVDMMDGSGGTSLNMNVNEVLANRALQLLGESPGRYDLVHPNDHVNLGQSTNDVVPSAAKLAIYVAADLLIESLAQLGSALDDRSRSFADVLRVGRTCMQAAQPMRLGQALGGYAAAIRRTVNKLSAVREDLLVLPLGGTAIGTGLGSAPGYRSAVYVHLRQLVGADVQPGADMFDAMQSADAFTRMSSEVRIAGDVVARIASDLMILSSDPESGIGELDLPKVQPGSSIMPGKVNPVLPMMMQQVAFLVAGNHSAISLASLHGQMEINHFEPVIIMCLLDSVSILGNASRIFAERCIIGLEVNRDRSLENLMNSSAISTVFVPILGYDAVANLVKTSKDTRRSIIDIAIEKGLITKFEVLKVLQDSTTYRD